MEEDNKKKKRLALIVLLLLFLAATGLLFISRELPFSHDPLEDDSRTWVIRRDEKADRDEGQAKQEEDGGAATGNEQRTAGSTSSASVCGIACAATIERPKTEVKPKTEEGSETKRPGTETETNQQQEGFHVQDAEGNEWQAVDGVNIFSNEEYEGKAIIAPQSSGVYRFFITNGEGKTIYYSIRTREINEAEIPMVYRLKYNGAYISGWKSSQEISLDRMLLKPGKRDILELEWKWQNSERDSAIGRDADRIAYHLYLRLQAEEVAG